MVIFHAYFLPYCYSAYLNIFKQVCHDNLQSLLAPEFFVVVESTTKATRTAKIWKFPFLELNLLIFCAYSMSLAWYEVKEHEYIMYLFSRCCIYDIEAPRAAHHQKWLCHMAERGSVRTLTILALQSHQAHAALGSVGLNHQYMVTWGPVQVFPRTLNQTSVRVELCFVTESRHHYWADSNFECHRFPACNFHQFCTILYLD